MSDSESDYEHELEAKAEKALAKLLPSKSKKKYEKAYVLFQKWCEEKIVGEVNENIVLAYFSSQLGKYKSSTLWSTYSMLRATLNVKDNINILNYNNLRAFLKRKGDGYQAIKSRIFTKEELYGFIKNAPDENLPIKIALIVGVYGACRRAELVNLSINDIEYIENGIKINLTNTKNKVIRQFVIDEGQDPEMNFIEILKKYAALRPLGVPHSRFFIAYRKGKCTRQPIGINMIGSYPKKIASFLKLPFVSEYTGHCFRRSSASFLADSGAKRWKSEKIDEAYVENSLHNKRKIAGQTLGTKSAKRDEEAVLVSGIKGENDSDPLEMDVQSNSIEPCDSLASIESNDDIGSNFNITLIGNQSNHSQLNIIEKKLSPIGFNFQNLHNCSFHIYQK